MSHRKWSIGPSGPHLPVKPFRPVILLPHPVNPYHKQTMRQSSTKPLPLIPIGGNLLSRSRDDCPIYLNSSYRNLGYLMTPPPRTSYLDGPWAESNRHREIQGKERCKQATSLARQNRRFSKFRLRTTTTTTTTEEDRRPKRDRFSAHCKLPLPPLLSSLAVSTPDHSA